MSKKKTSMPATPSYQNYGPVEEYMNKIGGAGNYLNTGLTTPGASLSGLMGDTVNISPEISRLSQQYAQSQLDPAFRTQRQDLINTLEANNQLTGSTTGSQLQNLSSDYMASLTGMQAQYGIADVNRALQNRVSLYGTGLNAWQSAGSMAQGKENAMNQFALQNYENQVAAALMNQDNSGSLLGGGIGLYGGAVAGGLLTGGNPLGIAAGAALGGYTGYNINNASGQAMFGGLAQAGGAYAGSKIGNQNPIYGGSRYAPQTYTSPSGAESVTDWSKISMYA